MKSLAILLTLGLSVPVLQAADFVNGQAARAVIGQTSFGLGTAGATQQVLGALSGIAYANGTLYVADDNRIGATPLNNRIVGFPTSSIPSPQTDLTSGNPLASSTCGLCGPTASIVLGQPNFTTVVAGLNNAAGSSNFNNAMAVASDGNILAVADTDNNRVLIWTAIPTSSDAPANIVLGQTGFSARQVAATNQTSLRGPQGIWIQNGKLYVADTQNHRVLIWNSIPTSNNQPADLELGQPNFNTANQPPASLANPIVSGSQLLNPVGVSVSPDGTHLFVADLGYNRVLIWNSIPTQNAQSADVVVGQPDLTSSIPNNVSSFCPSNGVDSSNNPTFPARCYRSLNFPRSALSDGTHLFIADGGNDRVLVFNHIPTQNGQSADAVLGQANFTDDQVTNQTSGVISTVIDNTGSVDTIPSPQSLAWDGTNLYVSDAYNRRVMVFTPGDTQLQQKSVINAASQIIRQEGFVALSTVSSGKITAGDTASITIGGTAYTYTEKTGDTIDIIGAGLVTAIQSSNSNAGDPNVVAAYTTGTGLITLSSKASNLDADTISLATTTSNTANVTAVASGAYLTGGTSATVAPGTIVQINGTNLTDDAATHNAPVNGAWPTTGLDGVQVYMDGLPVPVMMVSPTQVVAQVPFTFSDRNSASVYVRTSHAQGPATVTNAAPITITLANPGLFASPGSEPRSAAGIAVHQSGNPSAVVSIDGTIKAADTATISVNSKAYTYTVVSTDTTLTVAQALVNLINAGSGDPLVTASLGGQFARVVLTAKQPGSAGSGIPIAGSASSGAVLIVTAYSSSTCCASSVGAPVTTGNPAQPGEVITFYATGLGLLTDSSANSAAVAGQAYTGPQPNTPTETVSATINGVTGQVIGAGLAANQVGMYAVQILMPTNLPLNANTQVYIAQDAFISNIVTIPIGTSISTFSASPNPIQIAAGTTTGSTTFTWSVTQASIEIHVNSPTGPLFTGGGSQGSATTPPWVTDGMQFFLIDPSTSTILGQVTVSVQQVQSLTISPNPIHVATGATTGIANLSWNVPGDNTGVSILVGGPNGVLFGTGGSTGSSQTGNWVTNGTTFCLVNASSPSLVYQCQVANLVQDPSLAPITITPNPIHVPPGATTGVADISWNIPGGTNVSILVGGPNGTLFTNGGSSGSTRTGNWVMNGTRFCAVGPFSRTGQFVYGCQVATLVPDASLVSSSETAITLSPNPIPVASGATVGTTTVSWNAPNISGGVEIHLGSVGGPLFGLGGNTGSGQTGSWVTDGMQFYLVDATTGAVLGVTTAHLGTISLSNIQVPQGSIYGMARVSWNAPGLNAVEIHVGSPTGSLFGRGGSSGNAATGNWVTEGMVFYLVDPSNQNVLGQTTAHLQQVPVISLGSDPIPTPTGTFGTTAVSWYDPFVSQVKVLVTDPSGNTNQFYAGSSSGSQATEAWIQNGTVFSLFDASNNVLLGQTAPAVLQFY